jgi:excisionase family DNA binding protein
MTQSDEQLRDALVALERRVAALEIAHVADQADAIRGSSSRKLVATVHEAALALRCSDWKIRDLMRAGRLPFIRLGDQKIAIPWKALEDWVQAETAAHGKTPRVIAKRANPRH